MDFNVKSKTENRNTKIVVVGAGTSGASLSIRLARENFAVCLIERERFPRHKLCGEFISPECFRHFQDLNVLDALLKAGGERISQTIFYATGGKSVAVPSKWFGADLRDALSLSRAEMDFRLLERAKKVGVEVLEDTSAVGILFENDKIQGVKIKTLNGATREVCADLFVDATGRASVLAKLAEKEFHRRDAGIMSRTNYKAGKFQISNSKNEKLKTGKLIQNSKYKVQNRLVGFKTHLKDVSLERGACEIYFFRGGYGGLSYVESNRANHCFLMRADVVKEFTGDANKIVEQVIFQNKRARETMKDATQVFDWLAVSVDGFGAKNLNPAPNLFTVGDAAAFIDPFTGSGMLTALESAEILAETIAENSSAPAKIAEIYKRLHGEKFQKRLRVCSLLRRAAFAPNFARLAITALSASARAREILARATRQNRFGGRK